MIKLYLGDCFLLPGKQEDKALADTKRWGVFYLYGYTKCAVIQHHVNSVISPTH